MLVRYMPIHRIPGIKSKRPCWCKINDIVAGEGITRAIKSKSSAESMEQTMKEAAENDFHGLCFVNLVDFDALCGQWLRIILTIGRSFPDQPR